MKRVLTAALLLTTLVTSACGWHLRGSLNVDNLQSLHVSAENLQSEFVKELKRNLSNKGVSIEANAPDAQYSLVILKESSERRTAGVGASARAAEYLLTESVQYLVLDKAGQVLLPESTVSAERSYSFDENQIISADNEAELIRKELRGDLIRQIARRLQHLTPAPTSAASES